MAMLVFLLLCMRRRFTIYEVKKEVFCGSGKRVLLYILVVFGVLRIMTISVFAEESKAEFLSKDWAGRNTENSQAEECQELNVTIYDQMGRKLLLQDGAVWKVSEDILLSIPLDELEKTEGKITVLYCKNIYFTTIFTSLSGTTISFIIIFPSVAATIFSRAFAAESISSLLLPGAMRSLSFNLPFT